MLPTLKMAHQEQHRLSRQSTQTVAAVAVGSATESMGAQAAVPVVQGDRSREEQRPPLDKETMVAATVRNSQAGAGVAQEVLVRTQQRFVSAATAALEHQIVFQALPFVTQVEVAQEVLVAEEPLLVEVAQEVITLQKVAPTGRPIQGAVAEALRTPEMAATELLVLSSSAIRRAHSPRRATELQQHQAATASAPIRPPAAPPLSLRQSAAPSIL